MDLVEDDLWLESNTGKHSCAQTHLGITKNIETKRVVSRLPLKHGKPAVSHVNRQASDSSMTSCQNLAASKRKNGHVVSNDDESVTLLHKQAKKQPSMSGAFVPAQDVQEIDDAAASQLMSKTRQPNTALMEGNTAQWTLGNGKRASSSSLLQSQASIGAGKCDTKASHHETMANGQADSLGNNRQEAENLDGKANALVVSSQQSLKQKNITKRSGVHHVVASKAHQLPSAARFLREPSTLGEDSLDSAPSGFSSSGVALKVSSQSVFQSKQQMDVEANGRGLEVANIMKQGSKHNAKHDMR